MSTTWWPRSWNWRSFRSPTVCPRWMSGAVGSKPCFTRSGVPVAIERSSFAHELRLGDQLLGARADHGELALDLGASRASVMARELYQVVLGREARERTRSPGAAREIRSLTVPGAVPSVGTSSASRSLPHVAKDLA